MVKCELGTFRRAISRAFVGRVEITQCYDDVEEGSRGIGRKGV